MTSFDADYFERGLESGVSCYTDYRWMPEMSLCMAHHLTRRLGLQESDKILDFGCSKGYLVKALRLLGHQAYGCDISEYAIGAGDPAIREHLVVITDPQEPIPFDSAFDWVISKDVFEHMDVESIGLLLQSARRKAVNMMLAIPLGVSPGVFMVPQYHMDKTHIQVQTREWWDSMLNDNGWEILSFSHEFPGMKENWTTRYRGGDGFWVLKRRP